LNGATAIKSDFLKGRILLNLDSEEEGAFFIGCAGGADSEITLAVQRKSVSEGTAVKITLSGLRGGHSGVDINTGRGNAVQLLARMLFNLKVSFDLINLEGGSKHNAIPREAYANIVCASGSEVENLKKAVQNRFDEICFEYKAVEKEMKLSMEPSQGEMLDPLEYEDKIRFLALLSGLPHGVMAMSQEIPDLVETSNNLAIVRCEEKTAKIFTSTRSSILSALEATRSKIEAVSSLAGASIKHLEGYPAWTPNLKSPLLTTMKEIHKKLTGKDPEVKAIHAGLECGIIGEKFDGMDMISFGPELKHPHSPDEKVNISSVERFWNLLVSSLEALTS
jgi:dipeptidase D